MQEYIDGIVSGFEDVLSREDCWPFYLSGLCLYVLHFGVVGDEWCVVHLLVPGNRLFSME